MVLIGPLVAIGLYELSLRREQGLEASWTDSFDVLGSPSFAAIAALGSLLMLIFIVWLAAADWIYVATFGNKPVASAADFLGVVFTTSLGWKLIVLGNGIGFLFALLVLTISAVSFRLCSIAMLERRSHFGQTGIRESGQGHRRGVTPFGALAPATSCRLQRNGPRLSVPKAWLARAGHHAA